MNNSQLVSLAQDFVNSVYTKRGRVYIKPDVVCSHCITFPNFEFEITQHQVGRHGVIDGIFELFHRNENQRPKLVYHLLSHSLGTFEDTFKGEENLRVCAVSIEYLELSKDLRGIDGVGTLKPRVSKKERDLLLTPPRVLREMSEAEKIRFLRQRSQDLEKILRINGGGFHATIETDDPKHPLEVCLFHPLTLYQRIQQRLQIK